MTPPCPLTEVVCVAASRGYILTPPWESLIPWSEPWAILRSLIRAPTTSSRDLSNYYYFCDCATLNPNAREGTFSRTFRVSTVCFAVTAMRTACSILAIVF